MGYMCYHAIVVTTWSESDIIQAHIKAKEIFNIEDSFHKWDLVSPIMGSPVNMNYTFFIGPDGSKEGWPESLQGDRCRAEFIKWLEYHAYSEDEGGGNIYKYAEIQYGDEDGQQKILNASNFKSYDSNDGIVPWSASVVNVSDVRSSKSEMDV